MKLFIFTVVILLTVKSIAQPIADSFYLLTPVEVKSIRASDKAPFTKTNLNKNTIANMNTGVDIPYLLLQLPNVITNSDAGNGIGYTNLHIRGTDATRINVTLNGIPFNDAESQATYFVDIPDFTSSVKSIQVQRGVGTSSNGSGSFGASINLSTNEVNENPFFEFNNTYGSFNTIKNTIHFGTGIKNGFLSELRISNIQSDGYIDRAFSKLKSAHFTSAYIGKKNSFRINVFLGKEKTYQAWYGISEADLKAGNRKINYAGTEAPGNPYANQTDNYWQNHYQFFFNHQYSQWNLQIACFYTKGKGFYEEYKGNQLLSNYLLYAPNDTADLIRRLWLDNNYYGSIFSFTKKTKHSEQTLGGAVTNYEGQHFGKIIWASKPFSGNLQWYKLPISKVDFNIYYKNLIQVSPHFFIFYDLQLRKVIYKINGFEKNPNIFIDKKYVFFNPKAGITFIKNNNKLYFSIGIANKEPNRDDFETGNNQIPLSEKLIDGELGYIKNTTYFHYVATIYGMFYKNQLALTGKINDIGAYTRNNIEHSYRVGIEQQAEFIFSKKISALINFSVSKNKILNYKEFIDDYDNGGQKINTYAVSTLAFSPSVVAASSIIYKPNVKIEFSLPAKFVGKQYLDNTQHFDRVIQSFFIQNLNATYHIKIAPIKNIDLLFQFNNIFNTKYESNGYTYNYIFNHQLSVNNYYYPMSGTNFLITLNVNFLIWLIVKASCK